MSELSDMLEKWEKDRDAEKAKDVKLHTYPERVTILYDCQHPHYGFEQELKAFFEKLGYVPDSSGFGVWERDLSFVYEPSDPKGE